MTFRLAGARALGVAALVAAASSASAFSSSRIYTIEGYLDCVPNGTAVIDRVDVAAPGAAKRQLLVTAYRTAGDVSPRNLSEEPMRPYRVWGTSRDVARVLRSPAGAPVKATVVLYREALPALLIADLEEPASDEIAALQPWAGGCRAS